MNTRQDYIRAAEIVRSAGNENEALAMFAAFVVFFKGDNPRFDLDRFRDACGVEAKSKNHQTGCL